MAEPLTQNTVASIESCTIFKLQLFSDICGYHSGVAEDTRLLVCDNLFAEQDSCSGSHVRRLALFTLRLSPKLPYNIW